MKLSSNLVQALRRIFWTVIVEGKYGLKEETAFEFKYIPDLHKTTLLERSESSNKANEGVERRNLRVFLIGCTFIAFTLFMAVKFARGLVNFAKDGGVGVSFLCVSDYLTVV